MAIGPKSRGTVLSEINVTPLVDVMLVLLVIVLVTAPLVQQGVDVELPEASAKPVAKIEGKLRVTGGERRLPSDVELGLYRITQEALWNIERHAGANRVALAITFSEEKVKLEVAALVIYIS